MKRSVRTAVTAGAGALAAGVLAACFCLLLTRGTKDAGGSRSLVVRITEASAARARKDTIIRVACELVNRTGKPVSFYPFPDLELAMRGSFRFRLEGSEQEWRAVYRGTMCGFTMPAASLQPGAKRRVEVVISSRDSDLRAEEGAVMALRDLLTSGQAIVVGIQCEAYALEKGFEPRVSGPASYRELKRRAIEVESTSLAVAVTAQKE
jgi:hypothetical protein